MHDIYKYIHHLKNCSHDFFSLSIYIDKHKGIDTNALLLDVFRGIDPSMKNTSTLKEDDEYRNYTKDHLASLHIAAWFFGMEIFQKKPDLIPLIKLFLFKHLKDLSRFVKYSEWTTDEDRMEEFVRTALFACEIIPDGESMEDAIDRLDALNTLKRNNVLSASTEAFERIIEIRKQMAEKKAREAASVYGRE